MHSRRWFCSCVATTIATGFTATRATAGSAACTVLTRATQSAVDPDAAITRLKEGNARFVSGEMIHCDLRAQVRATANGQAPFAAVVGCIDSRVPPEFVFDQRIGDIFCARVAGNFVNTDIIGSLEFATHVIGARAIVILGHSECGAIKGAIDDVRVGNLTAMLANIRPAVGAAKTDGERTSKNAAFVQAVAESNAVMAAAMLTEKSQILKDLVANKKLRIAAAMHDVATGKIRFL
jgi:carbonic anhydrase